MVTARREEDLFWAMEEGLRCPGIAAVVGETRAADPTAGRRLSLAAEKNGVPALLLRAQPAPPQSVCATRWRVASAPSHSTPGLNDLGGARWRVELRRNRFGTPSVAEMPSWLVEWNDETHCLSVVPQALDGSAGAQSTPKDWSARAAATVVWRDSCPRLAAVNPHARAAGLRPYMRLADSRTLVPDLVTTPVEPQADRRLIETLANWCDRYTPWVAIDPLGGAIAEEGSRSLQRRRLRRRCRPAARRHRLRPSLRPGRGRRTRAAGRPGRAPEPPRLHLPRRDGRHRGRRLGAGALRRDAGRSLLPAQRPARRARRAAGRGAAARQADPGDLPEARPAPHRRSLSPAARAAGAPLRRPAAHPARPGAGHARRADRAAPARRPPSARGWPSPSRSADPRTSPPRPAACSPPSAGSSSRRASARASSRSRSIASTARSTARPSAPAGPTATIPS